MKRKRNVVSLSRMRVRLTSYKYWNICSLRICKTELHAYLLKNGIDVACLQQTLAKKPVEMKGYMGFFIPHMPDQQNLGRGMAIYVKSTIKVTKLRSPLTTQSQATQAVRLHLRDSVLDIVNIYAAAGSDKKGYKIPDIGKLFLNNGEARVVCGDFNLTSPAC